jgi:hypothetical protein
MLEFVQALHDAFHTESKWLFVFYMGLTFALLFGLLGSALAYVVDTGYQRRLREREANTAPPPPAPQPIIIKDTAEADRLRNEVEQLKQQLDERARRRRDRAQVGAFLEEGNKIKARCDSVEPLPNLAAHADKWAAETAAGLKAIDPSYAARFEGATGLTYTRTINDQPLPKINNDVWNWVNVRTEALSRILETMPN